MKKIIALIMTGIMAASVLAGCGSKGAAGGAGDKITVANPYGYCEEISVAELLDRTSFEAYEDMPLFLKLGFAFGIFEKNTLFRVR